MVTICWKKGGSRKDVTPGLRGNVEFAARDFVGESALVGDRNGESSVIVFGDNCGCLSGTTKQERQPQPLDVHIGVGFDVKQSPCFCSFTNPNKGVTRLAIGACLPPSVAIPSTPILSGLSVLLLDFIFATLPCSPLAYLAK